MSRVATYLSDHLAATRDSVGYTNTLLLLFIPARYAQALSLFLWNLRYPIPVRAYNKSQYLPVHSDSALDTPRPLSQECTGPILNMVRRTPSVFK